MIVRWILGCPNFRQTFIWHICKLMAYDRLINGSVPHGCIKVVNHIYISIYTHIYTPTGYTYTYIYIHLLGKIIVYLHEHVIVVLHVTCGFLCKQRNGWWNQWNLFCFFFCNGNTVEQTIEKITNKKYMGYVWKWCIPVYPKIAILSGKMRIRQNVGVPHFRHTHRCTRLGLSTISMGIPGS